MISLTPGLVIYKYELRRRIDRGEGKFGQVWIAYDAAVDQEVALKVLDSSFTSAVLQLKEARIGNRLNHPNLLRILYADVASHGGTPLTLIAQEYHPRGSVSGEANSEGFIPITKAIGYGIDILRGLEHLHHVGILHNDIKPSNILLSGAGSALLTDYGISVWRASSGATHAPLLYHPHAAPESLASASISEATDIYQAGMTLFRLINGIGLVTSHFSADPAGFSIAKSKGLVPNPDDYKEFVPASVRRIIAQATKPDPGKRFKSALDFRRSLEKLHLRGYWDVDANGDAVGEGARYYYRSRIEPVRSGQFRVVCYRLSKSSGQERRIRNFCKTSLSRSEADRLTRDFMRWVVEAAD